VLEDLLARHPAEEMPPVFVGCGTDDPLYDDNARFAAQAATAGLDVRTDFRPGGHEWELWDAVIRDVLAWLPLRR
jgi:putative tributyrin esterase